MKKIFGIFRKRWVISLLGLLAIAVFIWFAGPYFGFADREPLRSPITRLLVILIIVLLWGLNNLRRQIKANRASDQIVSGLMDSEAEKQSVVPGKDRAQEEIKELKDRFDRAMSVLKKSRKKRGVNSLYDLPWYIVIGPPGSGKTTALENSGLEFPLADQFGNGKVQGVGGTRNCDWWFTNEAVLLDTAGRYVTQDSHKDVDSAAWNGFLDLLRKNRRRRPINGVIVAISLMDILQEGEQQRNSHVEAVRQRVNELYSHFGIRFPIYVMFTKCDLVSGFMDYFDDLGRNERNQVWGMTFPVEKDESADSVGLFGEEYDLLMQRLNDQLLWKLSKERDIQRRSRINGFPWQMASSRETLQQFLTSIFRSSRFETPALLRGVYFTSGTQEGTPIDRLMGSMARVFGLDQQALPSYGGHGKSYFINGLMSDVIFHEADLTGLNRRLEFQRAWLQRIAYIGTLFASVFLAIAWSASYTANKGYVNGLSESLEPYRKSAASSISVDVGFEDVLPRLDELRSMTEYAHQHDDNIPLHMRFWLYQGSALGTAASDAYKREMNVIFLPLIAHRLERMIENSADNPELQYETLKAYLMLGNPEYLDPEQISLLMAIDWSKSYQGKPDTSERLQVHLDTLLETGIRPVQLDMQLVENTRKSLTRIPLAEFVYGRLQREYLVNDELAFRITDAVGRDSEKVFTRSSGTSLNELLPGLFTYRGFHDVFRDESLSLITEIGKEDWVLGKKSGELTKADSGKLQKKLFTLYIDDYIRFWQNLLDDLQIVRFHNHGEAREVLDLVSGPSSPLKDMLRFIDSNTTLYQIPEGGQDLAKKAADAGLRRHGRLRRLFDAADEVEIDVVPDMPGMRIDRTFERLNQLSRSKDGRQPPVNSILDLLSELSGYTGTIGSGIGQTSELGVITGGSGSDITRRVQVAAKRQPDPVKRWMMQLTSGVQSRAISGARKQLNSLWQSRVLPYCQEMLSDRYPFQSNSKQEVTLHDFGKFFGDGGVMDEFFKSNLASMVDASSQQWRWRTTDGTSVGLSNSVLRQFQRADRIKETFFESGGQKPSISFSLKPLFLDEQVKRFMLDLDGEKFVYRHEPPRAQGGKWPGSGITGQVRVVFETFSGAHASLTEEGPWAWFRILDQSQLNMVSADRMQATFEAGSYTAKYEIRAGSVANPFYLEDLQKFHCPERL